MELIVPEPLCHHDWFISYSEDDLPLVEQIVEFAEHQGITCWHYNRDMPFGADYMAACCENVLGAKAVLLVLTPSSAHKTNIMSEIAMALNNNKPVYPILCGIELKQSMPGIYGRLTAFANTRISHAFHTKDIHAAVIGFIKTHISHSLDSKNYKKERYTIDFSNRAEKLVLPTSYEVLFDEGTETDVNLLKEKYLDFEQILIRNIPKFIYNAVSQISGLARGIDSDTFFYHDKKYKITYPNAPREGYYNIEIKNVYMELASALDLNTSVAGSGKIRKLNVKLSASLYKVINIEQLANDIASYLEKEYAFLLNSFKDKIQKFDAIFIEGLYTMLEKGLAKLDKPVDLPGSYHLSVTQIVNRNETKSVYCLNSSRVLKMLEILINKVDLTHSSALEMAINFISLRMKDTTRMLTDGYERAYQKRFDQFVQDTTIDWNGNKVMPEVEEVLYTADDKRDIYVHELAVHSCFSVVINASGHWGDYIEVLRNDRDFMDAFQEKFRRNAGAFIEQRNDRESSPILNAIFDSGLIF